MSLLLRIQKMGWILLNSLLFWQRSMASHALSTIANSLGCLISGNFPKSASCGSITSPLCCFSREVFDSLLTPVLSPEGWCKPTCPGFSNALSSWGWSVGPGGRELSGLIPACPEEEACRGLRTASNRRGIEGVSVMEREWVLSPLAKLTEFSVWLLSELFGWM